jgi:hypothetical protein
MVQVTVMAPIKDIDLLRTFKPVMYADKKEKQKLTNLNMYIDSKEISNDNSIIGVVKRTADITYLMYFFYYAFDDGLTYFDTFQIDRHQYDMETVVVELDSISETAIKGVIYLPHGGLEHFAIRDRDDLSQIFINNHPVVYCSQGKHASYPTSGRIFRYGGFANDICDPVEVVVNVTEPSDKLMATPFIDGLFANIPIRVNDDLTTINTIRLKNVHDHMLFTLPSATEAFYVRNKRLINTVVISVILVIVLIITGVITTLVELRNKKIQ